MREMTVRFRLISDCSFRHPIVQGRTQPNVMNYTPEETWLPIMM